MSDIKNQKIVMIGAGNVAYHLSNFLVLNKFNLVQIYSISEENATALGKALNISYTSNKANIVDNADIYIVSIKDDVIKEFLNNVPQIKNKLIAHTSGSVEKNVLNEITNRAAVFYPLQTFSKDKKVDFDNIPFCLEASNEEDLKLLENLAQHFSKKIFQINSEQRAAIHRAAVFACNFSNFMYVQAEKILKNSQVDFNILHPLILETAQKAVSKSPFDVQTGPAKRKDLKVIKKHLTSLNNDEKEIYELMTNQIIKTFHNE